MRFSNYRKETSERSDCNNWAKHELISKTIFYFDSIEGCNQNASNVVTHIMERARVDVCQEDASAEEVLESLKLLETSDRLQRKINFAATFSLPLTYVLYNDETEMVWVYRISDLSSITFERSFQSYKEFSEWIQSIKGWKSSKQYREKADLPYFDKCLRKYGCAWPTNIDCFVSDVDGKPIGIIEFQNADKVGAKNHCHNEFFFGKHVRTNYYGYPYYENDIRRWKSLEILRLQSQIPFYTITWDSSSDDFIVKEVDRVVFPNLPYKKDWQMHQEYQGLMHEYANTKDRAKAKMIASKFSSYVLVYMEPEMAEVLYTPPLSWVGDKTFPHIYYKAKIQGSGKDAFIQLVSKMFSSCTI